MSLLVEESVAKTPPESLVEQLRGEPGIVLQRSLPQHSQARANSVSDSSQGRYSLVTARPFLTFRSSGSRCEITADASRRMPCVQFGNPWHLFDALMARFELLDQWDYPFPLGGCFGFWGYDLKNFVEPKLPRRTINDLDLPDCHVGFYDSLVVYDHRLDRSWIISTGLGADGSRSRERASERLEFWRQKIHAAESSLAPDASRSTPHVSRLTPPPACIRSNLSRAEFIARVDRVQRYIRAGDIYQVNLSHRLAATLPWWGEAPDEPPSQRFVALSPARANSLSPIGGEGRGEGAKSIRTKATGSLREDAAPPAFTARQTNFRRSARGDARPTGNCPGWELFQRLSAVSPAPFSDRLILARAVPAPERPARPDSANQRHPPALGRSEARCAIDVRTANQPQGNGRTRNDHRLAAQRSGQSVRIRFRRSARPGAVGAVRASSTSRFNG
jgi:hypothetical protein